MSESAPVEDGLREGRQCEGARPAAAQTQPDSEGTPVGEPGGRHHHAVCDVLDYNI